MKRFYKCCFSLFCGALITVTGCGSRAQALAANDVMPERTAVISEDLVAKAATPEKKSTVTLPAYEYPEKDSVLYAVSNYLTDKLGSQYEKADVCIPVIYDIFIDESNSDDIRVGGDFWIFNYNLKDDTLETDSCGNYPGLIHLKKSGSDYEVTNFEILEEDEEFDSKVKGIFGDYYEAFMSIYSDADGREDIRRQVIAEYVFSNELPITQYQDYGWDPILLGDGKGYDGYDDFVQEQAGKKEFKDFDEIIASLKEGQGYTTINLYGSDVDFLVVTDMVFQADNSAYEASLYTDIGFGPYQLTTVSGNGSAYPLRYEKGILYAGDNHEYISYFSFENEETVGVMVKDCVTDGDAKGEYSGFLREDNSYDNDKEFTGGREEFEKLLTEREEHPVLEFTAIK